MKEELNIWTKNYIDVNALVTEKLLIQKSLEKARVDLETLQKKYAELDLKHKKVVTEYTAAVAKCDSYESELGGPGGRWVEGASSETASSDHDSGKHSDNSLITSSEECWAEINKGSRHKYPWFYYLNKFLLYSKCFVGISLGYGKANLQLGGETR